MDPDALRAVKERLSPDLLRMPGVSGVGISGGKLRVYLSEDSDTLRKAVRARVDAEATDAEVGFEVTGRFRRQDE
jgi:hypothetical protein